MQGGSLATASDRSARALADVWPLGDGLHLARWRTLDLTALEPSWRLLADCAGTPNAFFEPAFLRPSLELFDPRGDVSLALLVSGGTLRALLPVWQSPTYHGRRIPNFCTWLHANSFCGVPLIEAGFEKQFWTAFLVQADTALNTGWFLHLPQMPTDSPAATALQSVCAAAGRRIHIVRREARAMLASGSAPDAHLAAAMSQKKRKELRRQRNRLEDEGTVDIRRFRTTDGIDVWISDFLELERRGWKGTQGSALASDPDTEALFRNALRNAAGAGRLERLSLELDGRPIAMLTTLLAHPGSFAFKTAFDEDYARFSPGMLLQVENLALLDDPALAWCDSCAAADHPMIERIWRDRREIAWITVEAGRGWRRLAGRLWAGIEAWRMEKRT
ncbi:GNAT family N-acetyltransferase [Qipengyuania sp. 6B39]|uniref:GNAT family N-acetyltransferase n=1 Tax=Qipengyuania proteolytica TaxID=2867239 RepID=UPI001C89D6AD|nr:GNAT family N-acetyltransferase [Qipengyuania proteolytica]MBX7495559.1 GNAT family N-acetyltransferase [Qipengyuania proteolytica]